MHFLFVNDKYGDDIGAAIAAGSGNLLEFAVMYKLANKANPDWNKINTIAGSRTFKENDNIQFNNVNINLKQLLPVVPSFTLYQGCARSMQSSVII